jgi:phytoene synthase
LATAVDELGDDLDAVVRRVDPDRWLASRFIADARARADVVAIYAFEHELARALAVTREPLMAEIRLTWWADAIAEIFEGRPVRRHPVTLALAETVKRHDLPRGPFDALVEAYFAEPVDRVGAEAAAMALGAAVLGARDVSVSDAAAARATQDAKLLQGANAALTDLPATAFPVVAHATLVRAPQASALGKRLRLTWAVLLGRL